MGIKPNDKVKLSSGANNMMCDPSRNKLWEYGSSNSIWTVLYVGDCCLPTAGSGVNKNNVILTTTGSNCMLFTHTGHCMPIIECTLLEKGGICTNFESWAALVSKFIADAKVDNLTSTAQIDLIAKIPPFKN